MVPAEDGRRRRHLPPSSRASIYQQPGDLITSHVVEAVKAVLSVVIADYDGVVSDHHSMHLLPVGVFPYMRCW